jgi:hypothetical protein
MIRGYKALNEEMRRCQNWWALLDSGKQFTLINNAKSCYDFPVTSEERARFSYMLSLFETLQPYWRAMTLRATADYQTSK